MGYYLSSSKPCCFSFHQTSPDARYTTHTGTHTHIHTRTHIHTYTRHDRHTISPLNPRYVSQTGNRSLDPIILLVMTDGPSFVNQPVDQPVPPSPPASLPTPHFQISTTLYYIHALSTRSVIHSFNPIKWLQFTSPGAFFVGGLWSTYYCR